MTLSLRKGEVSDAPALGEICYRAFTAIAESHHFTPDFPDANMATAMLAGLLNHDGIFSRVADIDGRIVGSNFLDERNPISGVGPVTIDRVLLSPLRLSLMNRGTRFGVHV